MSVVSILKRLVPARLRPLLRRGVRLLRGKSLYDSRVQRELEAFENINVQDLPLIMQYWSKNYLAPMLAPFGFTDAIQFVRSYMARVCRQFPAETVSFLSIGAGTCASEINIAEWLREHSIENYMFECADINPKLLAKGQVSAKEKDLSKHFSYSPFN